MKSTKKVPPYCRDQAMPHAVARDAVLFSALVPQVRRPWRRRDGYPSHRGPARGDHLMQTLLAAMGVWLALTYGGEAVAATCLYVSSYHSGYVSNDAIEAGITSELKGQCELSKFYMDTKRHTESAFAKRKAQEAKELIDRLQPDVVIACDDNASKFLVMPYFKDAAIPFVFCGINWTVKPYGYPYSNATGMIEVAPTKPLLKALQRVLPHATHGVFLAADVLSQHKEFARAKQVYKDQGLTLKAALVKTMAEWKAAYTAAQQADFLVLGGSPGISDWDKTQALAHVHAQASIMTVTTSELMVPYSMLAMTKVIKEQGEWAAKVAVMILAGESPKQIPIVANRRWKLFVNPTLLQQAHITLSPQLMHKAVKVNHAP